MIGILNDDLSIILRFENGKDFLTYLCKDYNTRSINSYFIKDDMEFGVIYIAVTGSDEYSIVKIKDKENDIVIKLKREELKEDMRPIISVG